MRRIVADKWVAFNRDLEGELRHMYLDTKGLCTTGLGNLIDPLSHALSLPWMRPDGRLASEHEIAREWRIVKGRQDMAPRGGVAFGAITTLRLQPVDVAALIRRKLFQFDGQLRERFGAQWDEWPASAQMACLSMSWALGAKFKFPKFSAAARSGDFLGMAAECEMGPKHGTIIERNRRNRLLLEYAATCADPDTLPGW
jgi:GH24 family phage-related lysozyme (muramidase)